MSVYDTLKSLNIELPPVAVPAAAYVPFVQSGNLVFLSGHIAKKDGKVWVGQLGLTMTTDEAKQAARAVETLDALQTYADRIDASQEAMAQLVISGDIAFADIFADSVEPVTEARDALLAVGVDARHLFEDHASGAKDDRAGLARALEFVRPGDVLVVWKLDRLGRSLSHLLAIVTSLKKKQVAFRSLTENLDTTTPSGEFLFQVFGALAQYERALIQERVVAGLTLQRVPNTIAHQDVIPRTTG